MDKQKGPEMIASAAARDRRCGRGVSRINLIRRIIVWTTAAAMAVLVAVTVSGCGGTTTTTSGTTTNGLEEKSSADVLQETAKALAGAKSVHVVAVSQGFRLDARMEGSSTTGTLTDSGVRMQVTVVGTDFYVKTDAAGLKTLGAPESVQRQHAGQWIKVPSSDFTGLTLGSVASQLTAYKGVLEPKVAQETLDGRKVVVVSWQDGGKLYVANTGAAYPLHGDLKGENAGVIDFTDYDAPLHITAPSDAIDLTATG